GEQQREVVGRRRRRCAWEAPPSRRLRVPHLSECDSVSCPPTLGNRESKRRAGGVERSRRAFGPVGVSHRALLKGVARFPQSRCARRFPQVAEGGRFPSKPRGARFTPASRPTRTSR